MFLKSLEWLLIEPLKVCLDLLLVKNKYNVLLRWFDGLKKGRRSQLIFNLTLVHLRPLSVLYDTNPLITAKTNKAINKLLNDHLHVNSVSDDYEHVLHKASMIEEPLDLLIVDEASMVSERGIEIGM